MTSGVAQGPPPSVHPAPPTPYLQCEVREARLEHVQQRLGPGLVEAAAALQGVQISVLQPAWVAWSGERALSDPHSPRASGTAAPAATFTHSPVHRM